MKRKNLHRPEDNTTIFPPINPEDFPNRQEAQAAQKRQKRVAYYITALSILTIIISSITIISTLGATFTSEQKQPTPTAEPYAEITVKDTQIETIKTKLNFGAPNPPGYTANNTPVIIEYFKTPETPILVKTEITSIKETTPEQTYFIEEILSTYGESEETTPIKYWLVKITSQINKDEWNKDINLSKHIIPKSTPQNTVEEILITNWKDCSTQTQETIIEQAEIVKTTYCLIFTTTPNNTPEGIKYVGQDVINPNEYSVYNGNPITINHTPET